MMKPALFDNDDEVEVDAEAGALTINRRYAQNFQEARRRQELSRAQDLATKGLLDDVENGGEGDDSEEDEDETGRRMDPALDAKIFSTLTMIRNHDPSIYQPETKFFDSDDEIDISTPSDGDQTNKDPIGGNKERAKRKKPHKPVYLKDLTASQATAEATGEDEMGGKSYVENQADLKREFLQLVDKFDTEESQDQFFERKKRSKKEIAKEEQEVEELRKRIDENSAQENANLILKRYFGREEELDKNERFLRSYLLNSGGGNDIRWVNKDTEEDNTAHDSGGNEFDSEEENAFDEAAEKFESEYNFRFEESGSERVIVHPREIADTVRKDRKSESRKKARERKKERELSSKRERQEELKRLKNIKKKEMRKRLQRIRESAGLQNPDEASLAGIDLEGEFDPAEYDRKMAQIFGDDYYNSTVDEDKPPISDLIDNEAGDTDTNSNKSKGFKAAHDRVAANLSSISEDIAAFKATMDEYYKLNCEDYVDGMPTRFKYTSVNPSLYGLDWEDLLGMDDKDLNTHVSLKKLAPYKEDDGERMVLKRMKKRKWLERNKKEKTGQQTEDSEKEASAGKAVGKQRRDTYATVKAKKRKQ